MILSKREKYIGLGAGGTIALLLLNSFVWEPYSDRITSIETDHDVAVAQQKSDNDTLKLKKLVDPRWNTLVHQGLSSDEAQTESNLQHSLLAWAQAAGVSTQDLHGDPAKKEGPFSEIGYRVTVLGSTKQISKLLWSLEMATTIPIRVSELQINPQPDGSDNLSAHIEVTTLSIPDTSGPSQENFNPLDPGVYQ